MNKDRKTTLSIISVLLIFLCAGVGTFENPAVQTVIDAWSDVDVTAVRLFTSISGLVCVPVMLLTSVVIGRLVKYKTCMITGLTLALIGSMTPFFVAPNWGFVIACRVLVGIGSGMLGPRNALLSASVSAAERSKYISWATTIQFASSIVTSPVCGMLAAKGWNYSVLVNIFLLPVLLMVIFFVIEPARPESRKISAEEREDVEKSSSAGRISIWVWVFALSQWLMISCGYPLLIGVSTMFEVHGVGDASVSGVMVALFNVGGVLGGLAAPFINKIFGKKAITFELLVMAVSMAAMSMIPSLVVYAAGITLVGAGMCSSMGVLQVENAETVPASQLSFSSTLLVAACMLGNFTANYFINFFHMIFGLTCDIDSSCLGAAIVLALLAVFFLIRSMFLLKDKKA